MTPSNTLLGPRLALRPSENQKLYHFLLVDDADHFGHHHEDHNHNHADNMMQRKKRKMREEREKQVSSPTEGAHRADTVA